jgi:hypothetical protein
MYIFYFSLQLLFETHFSFWWIFSKLRLRCRNSYRSSCKVVIKLSSLNDKFSDIRFHENMPGSSWVFSAYSQTEGQTNNLICLHSVANAPKCAWISHKLDNQEYTVFITAVFSRPFNPIHITVNRRLLIPCSRVIFNHFPLSQIMNRSYKNTFQLHTNLPYLDWDVVV